MRTPAVLVLLAAAVSCAAPDHHRWSVHVPYSLSTGEDSTITGLRLEDEAPIHPDWSLYFAASVLDVDADGDDPGTASDIDKNLIEGALGLRYYFHSDWTLRPFSFGEVSMSNVLFDRLDDVHAIYGLTLGAGLRASWNRDWDFEAAVAYRYVQASLSGGAFPGLDFEDALSGVMAYVGFGYTW